MIKKTMYEAPDAELFFVRIEENILSGETGVTPPDDEDYNDQGNF